MGFFDRQSQELEKRGLDPARLPPGQYFTDRFPVLHAGVGTDRLLALWLMDSERAERRMAGAPDSDALCPDRALTALSHRTVGADPVPGTSDLDLDEPLVSVPIPADLDALRARDPELAVAWRQATRPVFETYLARSYEVRELVRDGLVSHYLLAERSRDAD